MTAPRARTAVRLTPRRLLAGALLATVALGLAMAIRYAVIEPRDVGLACVETPHPWWCGPRELLVRASTSNLWGLAALGAGALGLLLRWRWAALIAYAAGLAGLVLYNAGLGAAGLLLALIGLLRR